MSLDPYPHIFSPRVVPPGVWHMWTVWSPGGVLLNACKTRAEADAWLDEVAANQEAGTSTMHCPAARMQLEKPRH